MRVRIKTNWSCWSFFVFKFTNAKLTLRLTCSSNFRLIPATVCLQELLERLWLCFHWTLWRKVRWPLCIWIGALKIHSNRWYRQSKYDRKLKFCNLVVLAMIFSATNLEIKRNWKLAQNLKTLFHNLFLVVLFSSNLLPRQSYFFSSLHFSCLTVESLPFVCVCVSPSVILHG